MSVSKDEKFEHKLLDDFRIKGFEASLITTFSAYLPFYERVVLPRLVSSGCRYNIVLIDARQCSRCLAQPDTRPQLAGHAYILVPVRAPGAFHPKISLLAGRQRGLLLVGSHNLTLAGFGSNRELTNRVEIQPAASDGSRAVAAAAFRFVRDWLEEGFGSGTHHYVAAFDKMERMVPWLSELEEPSGDARFFGSRPRGESLWDRVRGVLTSDVERATVVGPFFDKELGFVRRLSEDLEPDSIIVGVEPETVGGFDTSADVPGLEFRNAGHLYRKSGYLHAKAIYLECHDGSCVLISGSANPTKAAWLTGAGDRARNAEAVMVRWGAEAAAAAEALGLDALSEPLEPEAQAEIRTRSRVSEETNKGTDGRITTALAVEGGLEIARPESLGPGDAFADVFGAHHEPLLSRAPLRFAENEALILECDQDVRRQARILVIESGDSRVDALVYHRAEIEKLTRTDRQQKLRRAIEGLEGEETDFEGLLAIVESVVFDDPTRVDIGPARGRKSQTQTESTPDSERSVGSLLVDLANAQGQKKTNKRQRLIREGDLAELLELLIYNLGQSLDRAQNAGLDDRGRSEEERIGSDDEEPQHGVDLELEDKEILEIVDRKVGLLVGRIVRRLRQVAMKEREQAQALMQLLAVLALLRSLRLRDLRVGWQVPGATLVPERHRLELLSNALLYLFGDDYRVFEGALQELADTSVDEIARLRGLLLWLAWECRLSKNRPAEFNEPEGRLSERLQERAAMLCLASEVVVDDLAIEEARKSIQDCVSPAIAQRALAWLQESLTWGREIHRFRLVSSPEEHAVDTEIKVGSIVYRQWQDDFKVVAGLSGSTVSLVSLGLAENDLKWGALALREVPLANDSFR